MKLSIPTSIISTIAAFTLMTAIGVNPTYANSSIDKQANCLALNVYFEARGETIQGQRAVAWATLNRVDHADYPDTICDVVWQPSQFSWTRDKRGNVPKDKGAWDLAQLIAWAVLFQHQQDMSDPTDGSIMFHASYAKPVWRKRFVRTGQIDSHVFYREHM